jgi:hypothetical protein
MFNSVPFEKSKNGNPSLVPPRASTFALPASPSYLARKSEPAGERLGKAVEIWDSA